MNDAQVGQALRTLRIIVAAMAFGIVAFGVVTLALVTAGAAPTKPELVIVLLPAVGGVAFVTLVAGTVLRRALCARLRHTLQDRPAADEVPEQTIGVFSTLTLISGALAEGPSLFGVVAFLLTSNWLALVVPLVGLLVLWGLLPSRSRLDRFVTDVTGQHGA